MPWTKNPRHTHFQHFTNKINNLTHIKQNLNKLNSLPKITAKHGKTHNESKSNHIAKMPIFSPQSETKVSHQRSRKSEDQNRRMFRARARHRSHRDHATDRPHKPSYTIEPHHRTKLQRDPTKRQQFSKPKTQFNKERETNSRHTKISRKTRKGKLFADKQTHGFLNAKA